MTGLLILWFGLLGALLVFAVGPPGRGGALTLAYFLDLSLIHVPGVLAVLGTGTGIADIVDTESRFRDDARRDGGVRGRSRGCPPVR